MLHGAVGLSWFDVDQLECDVCNLQVFAVTNWGAKSKGAWLRTGRGRLSSNEGGRRRIGDKTNETRVRHLFFFFLYWRLTSTSTCVLQDPPLL